MRSARCPASKPSKLAAGAGFAFSASSCTTLSTNESTLGAGVAQGAQQPRYLISGLRKLGVRIVDFTAPVTSLSQRTGGAAGEPTSAEQHAA
jgi:hypothetical protein